MNLTEVASAVEESDLGKRDIEVSTAELSINPEGHIIYQGQSFLPNDWAWYEVFSKASKGTTKTYMMNHPTELWSQMVNIDLANLGNKKWVLRTRDNTILGVVTKIYKVFNNSDVVRALQENIGTDHHVHRFYLDDKLFYSKILYPEGDFQVGEDRYHIGFVTSNSEVGYRNLSNSTMIYKLGKCDTQMSRHASMSLRHAGKTFEEMSESLGGSIESGRDLKGLYIRLVTEATAVQIREDDIEPTMDFVKSYLKLSVKKTKQIAEIFREESQTKMGLISAIATNASGMRGDLRIMMESAAGSLLEIKLPCERGEE